MSIIHAHVNLAEDLWPDGTYVRWWRQPKKSTNRDSVSTTSENTTVFTQPTLSVTDSTPLPESSTESQTLLVTGDSSDQESDTTLPKSVRWRCM